MRIMAVAGASGGHIYPAVSFLDRLKDKQIDTLLVLPKRIIKNKIVPSGFNVRYISASPIVLRSGFRVLLSALRFLKSLFESFFLLVEFKPDIVVGFGCIESVPLLFFAWLFRIKTLIHEQNVTPGRANKLLSLFVDKIAVSYSATEKYLKNCRSKIVLTGNPLRQELEKIEKKEAADFFGFSPDKFTVLVMGGSQGSRRVNSAFLKGISGIADKSKIQIIHLTGFGDYEALNKNYRDLKVESKIFDFFKAMHFAYSASDLVISRAGATSITEIIFFKLPAILIPYPYAYRHQQSNAMILHEKGSAIVIDDDNLDSGILEESLRSLISDPKRLKNMRAGYDGLSTDNAGELLVKEVMTLVN